MKVNNLWDQGQRDKILRQIELSRMSLRTTHKRIEVLKKLIVSPYKSDASDAQYKLNEATKRLILIYDWAQEVTTDNPVAGQNITAEETNK